MKKVFFVLVTLFIITGGYLFLINSHINNQSLFQAEGNFDSNERMKEVGDYGPFPAQVEISFDSDYSELKMRFCPPGRPVLVTENNIEFSNGYAETYDPLTGIEGSFEVWGDFDNHYTSMWIVSENNARIIVKWRSALVAPIEGQTIPMIAHQNEFSNSPFNAGYGDWVEETFYIYPDASRTRYSKIYTAFASESQPFGFDRLPPNYIHEFSEASVWNYNFNKPNETIHLKALTLGNMNGEFQDISFEIYPNDFGSFENSNIMRINLMSDWQPYVIGLNNNVTITPYEIETEATPFQSWTEDGNDHTTALAHMVNWNHYERENEFVSQVYLEGFIHKSMPIEYLSELAYSWIYPSEIHIESKAYSLIDDGYSEVDRAYHINQVFPEDLMIEFYPRTESVINPVIVVENWTSDLPDSILLNNNGLIEGVDFRQGLEDDSLVIWFNKVLEDLTLIEINR